MSEREALFADLLAELEPMAVEMVARTRAEMPSFGGVPADEHLRDTLASVEMLIGAALEIEPEPSRGFDLNRLGARRSEQGVPVEDLLRAWRLSITIGTERARRLAERRGLSAQRVIDLLQGALGTADEAMVSLVEGHRSARSQTLSEREEFVLAALAGSLAVESLRARATEYGLDVTRGYRAVRARGEDRELARIRGRLSEADGDAVGLFTEEGGGLAGLTGVDPDRAQAGRIAIGPVVGLESLAASDRIATRLIAAVDRFELAGVHDVQSAGLQLAVLESGDVGEAMRDRYLGPLGESPGSAELIASLRAWLEAGMRVGAAADRLHVHENTLRYRLRRYGELAGVDLAVTEDLVGIWWALQRDRIAGR